MLLADELLLARGRVLPAVCLDGIESREVAADDFRIPGGPAKRFAIGITPGRVATDRIVRTVPANGNQQTADPPDDLAEVRVVERHGRNREIGRAFVYGFGIRRGSIASSVGHDSQNIPIVQGRRQSLLALRDPACDLGRTLPEPFFQMAFLPLVVVSRIAIGDQGVFDFDAFAPVGD